MIEYPIRFTDLEDQLKAARDVLDRDPRVKALVYDCVIRAKRQHGPVDPTRADSDAQEIAFYALGLMVARVYYDDGEIKMARIERDYYRSIAEKSLHMQPMPPVAIKLDEFSHLSKSRNSDVGKSE